VAPRLRLAGAMTLDAPAAVLTGLSLGTLSVAHCTLMCGPVALVGRAHGRNDRAVAYFVGRLATYTALGTLVGGLGGALLETTWSAVIDRVLSLVLAGSLLWAAWRAVAPRHGGQLVSLGRGPKRAGTARVLARLVEEPLLLGAATVLLPCAALFAAASAAAATGSALGGAVLMAGFCSVTGVAVVGVGGLLERLLAGRRRRLAFAVALVIGSVLTLLRPAPIAASHPPSCPLHAGATP
jgi:sulfite exporter TauE/SafE